MESQPQNPEYRNNPENFHTCSRGMQILSIFHPGALPVIFSLTQTINVIHSKKIPKPRKNSTLRKVYKFRMT